MKVSELPCIHLKSIPASKIPLARFSGQKINLSFVPKRNDIINVLYFMKQIRRITNQK